MFFAGVRTNRVDLPTYTNIWRIEKRLYKLYDLRLPMPLPIVWIGVNATFPKYKNTRVAL